MADRLVHQVKQHSNLKFNPEFSIQFKIYFYPQNLKSEKNNPGFKLRFNILLQIQSIVAARGSGQLDRVLGIYNFAKRLNKNHNIESNCYYVLNDN